MIAPLVSALREIESAAVLRRAKHPDDAFASAIMTYTSEALRSCADGPELEDDEELREALRKTIVLSYGQTTNATVRGVLACIDRYLRSQARTP